MQTLEGTRFGNIEFDENELVTFSEGLIGFPTLNHFIVIPHKPDSPFHWLQSVEEPGLAFLTVDPTGLVNNYSPTISDGDAKSIALTNPEQAAVLVTASIPNGDPSKMTVNLVAPIVVNTQTRKGKQVVLEGEAYTIRYRVFDAEPKTSLKQAA
jgi:flagellar assembly factor FliW